MRSRGRRLDLPRCGRAVVKDMANSLGVLDICRAHEALCKVKVAMRKK